MAPDAVFREHRDLMSRLYSLSTIKNNFYMKKSKIESVFEPNLFYGQGKKLLLVQQFKSS